MRSIAAASAALLLSLALCPSPAWAEDDPLVGRHLLSGERDDGARFTADLRVERRPSGGLRLKRVESSTDAAGEVVRRNWLVMRVEREGAGLRATYHVPALRVQRGAAGALRGERGARAPRTNRIEARYTFRRGQVEEVLVNLTRFAPETSWKTAKAQGASLAGRLRLGHKETFPPSGRLHLLVPAQGVLTLTLQDAATRSPASAPDAASRAAPRAAELRLRSPAGQLLSGVAPVQSGGLRVVSGRAPLGLVLVEGPPGARVRARFARSLELPAAQRPWKAKSYYPIYAFDDDGTPNLQTLHRPDGALERFDRAFKLRAPASAQAWERGGACRTSVDFGHGHYVRRAHPRELEAERDWHVDVDGDGIVGGTRAAVFAALDLNKDGAATEGELRAVANQRVLRATFELYDADKDGRVALGRELGGTRARAFDRDRSGALDRAEMTALFASSADLRAQLARRREALLQQLVALDRDGDKRVVLSEVRAGGWDFSDSEDADLDGRVLFDAHNLIARLRGGRVAVGNRLLAKGDHFQLFGGPDRDQPIARYTPAELLRLHPGADGDLLDEGDATWWGHCDAAAIAGILFREPKGELRYGGVTLRRSDQEGILVELAMGSRSLRGFSWSRDGRARTPRDYAAGFHAALFLGLESGRALLADVSARPRRGGDHEVWNYAVYGAELQLREAEGEDPYVLDATGFLVHTGGRTALRYRLHHDLRGAVRADAGSKTTWLLEEEGEPHYLRYLYTVDPVVGSAGSTRNPFVTRARVAQLYGGKLPLLAPRATGSALPERVPGD